MIKDGFEVTLSAPDLSKIRIRDNILTVDPYLRIDGDHTLEIKAFSGGYSATTLVTILSPPLTVGPFNFPPIVEGERELVIKDNLRFEFSVFDEDAVEIDSMTF